MTTTPIPRPTRRPLQIYSKDPITPTETTVIDIANEALKPGPVGPRIAVIDYDTARKTYYEPVDLDEPNLLMQQGLSPTESDPRFHQQMVYAVATKVLENFDHALGRKVQFPRGSKLRILPHAFHGTNAYFDPKLNAVLFGYFQANSKFPGRNLPRQMVFTCLSHDIIAHEVTHAIVYRLRRHFSEPTNIDVLAFHEGFSDIVALMQHFSYTKLLEYHIQKTRTYLHEAKMLVGLAQQFGEATGMGRALRSAIEPSGDIKVLSDNVVAPHDRGAILVAAIFDAFFQIYQARIKDLVRIATGGTGTLPEGDLPPDLVNRVAREASKAAGSVLNMCMRAFDYLPPVDITFGDYLRALITADAEVVSQDRLDQRTIVIECFRKRNIRPEGVVSQAESSLRWTGAPGLERIPGEVLRHVAVDVNVDIYGTDEQGVRQKGQRAVARALHAYAKRNAAKLQLDPNTPIAVEGFHPSYRVAPDGCLLIDLIAQFVQTDRSYTRDLGGVPLRGGTTIIASHDGEVRFVIAKPLPKQGSASSPGAERLAKQRAYIHQQDYRDAHLAWGGKTYWDTRTQRRMSFKALCGGR